MNKNIEGHFGICPCKSKEFSGRVKITHNGFHGLNRFSKLLIISRA